MDEVEKMNRTVDEWVAKRRKKVGTIVELKIDSETQLFGLNNTLASKDLIRHYADAMGDLNPLWRDEGYARHTRYGSIIAPPTFLNCIAPVFFAYEDVPGGRPHIPGFVSYNGGSLYKWFRVIYAGDEIGGFDEYLGIEEKTRKDRPVPRLFVDTCRRTYVNQKGEPLAIVDSRLLHVVPESPSKPGERKLRPAFPNVTKHHYTEAEKEAIYRAYAEEERRGRNVRFWEDATVGEELRPVVKGPIDIVDMVCMFAAMDMFKAFGAKHKLFKADPTYGGVDPETGWQFHEMMVHLNDGQAQILGLPSAVALAHQSEAALCHMICNWMGDDGFLKQLDCHARRINPHGDITLAKAKIARKYVEGDEHLVDLEAWCQNQDGIIHMPASATVRLLSRDES